MPASFVPCPACDRHLLAVEARCPFCEHDLSAAPQAPRTSRAKTVASVALAAAITAGGGALAASHLGLPFARASTVIVEQGPIEDEAIHVAVPCYGTAPPPLDEEGQLVLPTPQPPR